MRARPLIAIPAEAPAPRPRRGAALPGAAASDPAWLAFWFQPWRWADPDWQSGSGIHWPGHDAAFGACYRAWCLRHTLAPCWTHEPAPAWRALLAQDPAVLRKAALVVGHVLRHALDPGSRADTLEPADDAQRQASRYSMSRPLRVSARGHWESLDPCSIGLCALSVSVRENLAEAAGRTRMLLKPELAWRSEHLLRLAPDEAPQHLRLWRAALRWAARPESPLP